MAMQPPAFRPPGWRERNPWAPQPAFKDRRKRGRAGMRERAEVLLEEPFCRHCLAQGKEVRAVEVDHIKPLAWGGADVRSNKQALCIPCHQRKTRAERHPGPA
ncbi:HNH endonuclease [Novosphingobium humi]|uniref:HNH endonuclease signature motif containing protein n=1 Tax=Novosphingobium humi TaxID=2282397 RepID=A0ABY7U045_9SPHN|nr:HNH endonuclease signature motif containing protein [Novosphingobium humi]WCT78890.1 HNH endonuclease signature motif containing protein [Novosphingobium humi]